MEEKPKILRMELTLKQAHEFRQVCSTGAIARVREVVILADLLREDEVFGKLALEVLDDEC